MTFYPEPKMKGYRSSAELHKPPQGSIIDPENHPVAESEPIVPLSDEDQFEQFRQEALNAAETRFQPESYQPEYQGTQGSKPSTETSGSDSSGQSG